MPTVILTGATRGIGRAAAIELARRGAEVAIVGRDSARVEDAASEVAAVAGGTPTHRYVADLSQLGEVRLLAAELLERHERIDVLANNAGAMFTSRHLTDDGFEQTFALNHLSAFLLTNLLLERLAESSSRVITTASDAHRGGRLDLDDVNVEHVRYRPAKVYATSKLCNVLFTRELQRRRPDLAVNCFHPGVVRTGFGKNDGLVSRLSMTAIGPFLRSPERGAEGLVWLALDDDAGDLHGAYVERMRVVPPSDQARDDDLAKALWERSERLTGLSSG